MSVQLESSEFNSTQNQQLPSKIIAMKLLIFLSLVAFDFSASAMPVDLASTGQKFNILVEAVADPLKVKNEGELHLGVNGSTGSSGKLTVTYAENEMLTIGENALQLTKEGIQGKTNIAVFGTTVFDGSLVVVFKEPSVKIEANLLGFPVKV